MKKYIAFLRAINVGGHTVKMDHLRSLFVKMKFKNPETFIASGNVLFGSDKSDISRLEDEIEKHLLNALGYEVATFIRTPSELQQIVDFKPFPVEKYDSAVSNNIGFIKQPLKKDSITILKSLETEIDDFQINQTEVYWLCKTGQSKSVFSGNLFERKLKTQITFRGVKTLQKLLLKYS